MVVTAHAAQRWVERVDPRISTDEAREAIKAHSRVIEAAAQFGCHCIRLGSGAKLVLEGATVVTVLPRKAIVAMRISIRSEVRHGNCA